VNHKTGKIIDCPEEEAGLYVVDRVHPTRTLKIVIPFDCLAVQIGECTEILTGGAVQATPHCVRGCHFTQDIGRISLPCFVDTPPSFALKMPPNCTREQVLAATCTNKVPLLEHRWSPGITFGDFLQQTFSMYYPKK
jgi:isopenicillin N synthase-like dioxygenase